MDASSSPLPLRDGFPRESEDSVDSSTQRDLATEAHFLARFDPLAMLEAEYAAVLAQSRPPPPTSTDSDDDDGAADDEEDGRSAYAALPTSPSSSSGRNGGDDGDDAFYQPLGDDSDCEGDEDATHEHEDRDGADDEQQDADAAKSSATNAPQLLLESATRSAIMQSMQRLALAPPPWAKDASLSDDDLVAMVRRQMQR